MLVWFRITLMIFRARIATIHLLYQVIPKTLLVPFFSGHGVYLCTVLTNSYAVRRLLITTMQTNRAIENNTKKITITITAEDFVLNGQLCTLQHITMHLTNN